MVCLLEILFSVKAELCKLLDRSALGAFPCHTQKIGLEISFCISTVWNEFEKSTGGGESATHPTGQDRNSVLKIHSFFNSG